MGQVTVGNAVLPVGFNRLTPGGVQSGPGNRLPLQNIDADWLDAVTRAAAADEFKAAALRAALDLGDESTVPDAVIAASANRGNQILSLLDIGGKGDGTTDNAAVFAAIPVGSVINLPKGSYRVNGTSIMSILSGLTILGSGKGVSFIDWYVPPGVGGFAFTVGSQHIFAYFTLRIHSTSTNVAGVQFTDITPKFNWIDFEIDGTNSANTAHGVTFATAAIALKGDIDNCDFHDLFFGMFSNNNFTGQCKDWHFRGGRCYRNVGDDFELNSAANLTATWQRIIFDSWSFSEWLGDPGVGAYGFAIGLSSTQQIEIGNCTFDGYTLEAIHVDTYCYDVHIHDCTSTGCKIFASIYEDHCALIKVCDNTCTGNLAVALDADPASLPDPSLTMDDNWIAIYFRNPGETSSPSAAQCTGNIISRYTIPIYAPIDRGGMVEGNTAYDCSCLAVLPYWETARLRNNRAVRCKYVYYDGGAGGHVGFTIIENCPNWFFNKSASPIIFTEGFKVCIPSGTLTIDTSGDQFLPIIPAAPAAIGGGYGISVRNYDLGSYYALSTHSIVFGDGQTLLDTILMYKGFASFQTFLLSVVGSAMVLEVYHDTSADTNTFHPQVEMDATGMWVF